MLKMFFVVYTLTGGVGAVWETNAEGCAYVQNHWERRAKRFPHYAFRCEPHETQPRITVTIPERKLFESKCSNLGLPAQCRELPNGDVQILTTLRDKRGNRVIETIKAKDLR